METKSLPFVLKFESKIVFVNTKKGEDTYQRDKDVLFVSSHPLSLSTKGGGVIGK